ncbi:MAG: type II toxin-antitoxin system HigB family toxin [Pyrinomonadaceae bacterium]|nr:type II toxin-antitoxin system HigB family toxin [Pyrinomonadaceae bacterium]
MRIISRKALRTFWETHPESEEVLRDWYAKVKGFTAKNFAEVRRTFPSADLVGDCIVFNVGGNKYRLVVHLDHSIQTVWIRAVMSHAEYDRGKRQVES